MPSFPNACQPEFTKGLELFSKHKGWMPFLPLCFPSKDEKLEEVSGEGQRQWCACS